VATCAHVVGVAGQAVGWTGHCVMLEGKMVGLTSRSERTIRTMTPPVTLGGSSMKMT
jgi:hypothetical protein